MMIINKAILITIFIVFVFLSYSENSGEPVQFMESNTQIIEAALDE